MCYVVVTPATIFHTVDTYIRPYLWRVIRQEYVLKCRRAGHKYDGKERKGKRKGGIIWIQSFQGWVATPQGAVGGRLWSLPDSHKLVPLAKWRMAVILAPNYHHHPFFSSPLSKKGPSNRLFEYRSIAHSRRNEGAPSPYFREIAIATYFTMRHNDRPRFTIIRPAEPWLINAYADAISTVRYGWFSPLPPSALLF